MSELYKLSKDMLVKLITTIREDTINEFVDGNMVEKMSYHELKKLKTKTSKTFDEKITKFNEKYDDKNIKLCGRNFVIYFLYEEEKIYISLYYNYGGIHIEKKDDSYMVDTGPDEIFFNKFTRPEKYDVDENLWKGITDKLDELHDEFYNN